MGTNNKTKIENISIKLATTIIQHTQKATTKTRITVEAAEKIMTK